MTVYRRCVRCTKRNGCPIKARLSEAIRGLGITSVLHKCDEFEPPFAAGQPIIARMVCMSPDDIYDNKPSNADYPAWFVLETKEDRKALIFIQPGQLPLIGDKDYAFEAKNDGFCKVAWWRLSADERSGVSREPCPICGTCGRLLGQGDCVLYGNRRTMSDCKPMEETRA